jgi:hypothetical protein
LERDFAEKVRATNEELMRLTDDQLEVTTKRTILENEELSMELASSSKRAEKALARSDEQRRASGETLVDLELANEMNARAARRGEKLRAEVESLIAELKLGEERLREMAVKRADDDELVQEEIVAMGEAQRKMVLRAEARSIITPVPVRPRSRGERRSLRTLLPGGRLSPPIRVPRSQSRRTNLDAFRLI